MLKRSRPTNPFRHQFHPDHDNLDAQYAPIPTPTPGGTPRPDPSEVFEIRRDLTLDFDPNNPPFVSSGNRPPDWGTSVLGGTYKESISGLHRSTLNVQGQFLIRRASVADTLNPTPAPTSTPVH